jgi:folate-dependent phosphoribosylglycinamide formyltransferase PurN
MKFNHLRVAVLSSDRSPGIEGLLHHPHRGNLFDVAAVITSASEFPQKADIQDLGVQVLDHSMQHFLRDRRKSLPDMEARREYDAITATLLRYLGVDTVLCLGYAYLLTEPVLSRFPDRILNIHDSDLTIRRSNGERCYTGLHSTRDAIMAGEKVTRSTVHFVTQKVDHGPVLLMSEAYAVAPFATAAAMRGQIDIVKPYAYIHRQSMMSGWGELAARGLEYLAAGICDEGVVDASDALVGAGDGEEVAIA